MASHLIIMQIVCLIDELGLELVCYTNPHLHAADSCKPLRMWMTSENRSKQFLIHFYFFLLRSRVFKIIEVFGHNSKTTKLGRILVNKVKSSKNK